MRAIKQLLSFTLLGLGLAEFAWAYIPRAHLIFEKSADTHGRGAFQVVQEVQIPMGQETFTAREYWTVVDGESLYVFVEGLKNWEGGLRLAQVFHKDKKYWVDENGEIKSAFISKDFFEPYFHFRSAKGIASLLINAQIVPRNVLAQLPAPASLNAKPTIEPQKFLRLARLDSSIAFAFGEPTPQESKVALPGLWIEQDNFNVLKIRLPSLAEIEAEDYASYPQNLQLPQKRSLRWGEASATIHTLKVASLGRDAKNLEKVQPNYLKELVTNRKLRAIMPRDPLVVEFYKRFR